MVLEEMSFLCQPWYLLQQPAHPVSNLTTSFRTLLAAVDQGWHLEEPVMIATADQQSSPSFHITLIHRLSGQAIPLVVQATADVEQFLHRNGYRISESVHASKERNAHSSKQ